MRRNLLVAAVALSLCIPLGASRYFRRLEDSRRRNPRCRGDSRSSAVVLRDEAVFVELTRREPPEAHTLARHPDLGPRPLAGRVCPGGQIVVQPFEKQQSPSVDDDVLERYRERRDAAAKTFADQKELADWCRKAGPC